MIKLLRKWRKRMWTMQIWVGDLISILVGGPIGYIKRLIRKKLHKATGKQINKLKPKGKSK